MHHLPDDRPGPDDRHLHDDVVEAGGLETRQRRHLRARFDLKHADRVRLAQHAIDRRDRSAADARDRRHDDLTQNSRNSQRIFSKECSASSAVSALIVVLAVDQRERILNDRHHPEAEEIDFDDAHVGAVVLVPLHDDAAGHAGVFERDDGVELTLADDHAAGMLAEMPRQILNFAPQPREQPHAIRVQIQADRREMPRQRSRPDR